MARRRSRVQGAPQLMKTLRTLPDIVTEEVKEAVSDAIFAVFQDAVRLMPKPGSGHPYSDGTLLRRFTVKFTKGGLAARVGSWGRGRAAHIALVEFGVHPHDIPMPDGSVRHHPGAPAQPFLMPAYRLNRNKAIADIRAAVIRAIRRAAAGESATWSPELADAADEQITADQITELIGYPSK